MSCELCTSPGGMVLWQDDVCRIVHVDEPGYPGYCRVVWKDHVKEVTDLDAGHRAHLWHVVLAVETVLRDLLHPDKINLASLGNMTPHVHWHVIPRFAEDPHFPQSVWSAALREPQPADPGLAGRIRTALAAALGPGWGR